MNVTRHDADLDFVGRNDAWTVRSYQSRFSSFHPVAGAYHIAHGDTFCDTDYQVQFRIHRFIDCRCGKRRRYIDYGNGRPCCLLCFLYRGENRNAVKVLAPFLRIDPGNKTFFSMSVIATHPCVELPRLAGNPLRHDTSVTVDQDRHTDFPRLPILFTTQWPAWRSMRLMQLR